jgi:hypothetical protein
MFKKEIENKIQLQIIVELTRVNFWNLGHEIRITP